MLVKTPCLSFAVHQVSQNPFGIFASGFGPCSPSSASSDTQGLASQFLGHPFARALAKLSTNLRKKKYCIPDINCNKTFTDRPIGQALISWEEKASMCLGSPCISFLSWQACFCYDSGFHRNGPCVDQTNPLLHSTNSCKLWV